jgi:muramoyltetrapeptide carboxypeptidase
VRDPVMRPPHLRSGARVALVSPAGPISDARLASALDTCARLGLDAVVGGAALRRHGYLAGEDAERAADLNAVLADPSIDAVWALRGGYGTMRILDALRFGPLEAQPKAFIGFSDNTAIHLALARDGIVCFHGPHAGGAFPPFTEQCFRSVLFSAEAAGTLPVPAGSPMTAVVPGTAEGRLAGGNLSLLAALCGTPWALDARGAILFLEEVGEPTYRIDRALTQLRLAGTLEGIAGLVLGQFTERRPSDNDLILEEVLAAFATDLDVPCIAGAPIGHVDDNWCLPVGVRARLDAAAGTLSLLEPATSEAFQ